MMWGDRTQVQKGVLGETIIDRYLKSKNLIPYQAVYDGAHPFDRIIASPDKKNIYLADAKTKARRTYYPDTGININHYMQYEYLMDKYNIRVFLFFVDEWQKKVYGNFLDLLQEEVLINHNGKDIKYPFKQGRIIYFPLTSMRDICELEDLEAEKLKQLSLRNYSYLQEVI